MWLVVHSLLMYQETYELDGGDVSEDVTDELKRQERCRLAVIAAMVATQEVKSGMSLDGDEDVAVA